MDKKPCTLCGKLITCSNMSRHMKTCHVLCQFCQKVTSAKRHICLQPEKATTLLSDYVAVWLPVLMKKEVYNREKKTVSLVQFQGEQKNFADFKLAGEDAVVSKIRAWYLGKKYENCLTTCGMTKFFQNELHRCVGLLPHQHLLDLFSVCCMENSFVFPERGSKEERDLFMKFICAIFSLEGIDL